MLQQFKLPFDIPTFLRCFEVLFQVCDLHVHHRQLDLIHLSCHHFTQTNLFIRLHKAVFVRNLCRGNDVNYENTDQELVESRDANTVANILICLICQTEYLLARQIAALEKKFLEQGGIRERMYSARRARRGEK